MEFSGLGFRLPVWLSGLVVLQVHKQRSLMRIGEGLLCLLSLGVGC